MDDLDQKIKQFLANGPRTNKEIREVLGVEDRLLDRQLQRLRKTGAIRVVGRRWMTDSIRVCDTCGGRGWVG